MNDRCPHGTLAAECPVCVSERGGAPAAPRRRVVVASIRLDNESAARAASSIAGALRDALSMFPADIAITALSALVADIITDSVNGDMTRDERLDHFVAGVKLVLGANPEPEHV